MIPFIKKYKFFIITAAAIVAALVIAFAAGNSINEDAAAPDEAPTFSADATSATGPQPRRQVPLHARMHSHRRRRIQPIKLSMTQPQSIQQLRRPQRLPPDSRRPPKTQPRNLLSRRRTNTRPTLYRRTSQSPLSRRSRQRRTILSGVLCRFPVRQFSTIWISSTRNIMSLCLQTAGY